MTRQSRSPAEYQEIVDDIEYHDSKVLKDVLLGIGGLCVTAAGAYLASRYGAEWSPLIIGGAGTSVVNLSLAMGRVDTIDALESRLPATWQ